MKQACHREDVEGQIAGLATFLSDYDSNGLPLYDVEEMALRKRKTEQEVLQPMTDHLQLLSSLEVDGDDLEVEMLKKTRLALTKSSPIPSSRKMSTTLPKCPANKALTITRLPKVLCLHIQRNSWDARGCLTKDQTRVTFGMELNIAKNSGLEEGEIQAQYNLSSVVEHVGSAMGGHYLSYKRKGPSSSQWLRCSDTDVREVDVGAVLGAQAFLLFYKKYITQL